MDKEFVYIMKSLEKIELNFRDFRKKDDHDN